MMKLVDCTEEHWEFVRKLRTDKNNSIWFYTQIEITPSQQKIFMENNSYKYKICLLDEKPVGYIGIMDNNEITYCVDNFYKNRGIGTFMVSKFIEKYDEVNAFVIPSNNSSIRVFEKLGFEKHIFFKYKK
jgi:RimJ/RimL family protein N-acetyltransferase